MMIPIYWGTQEKLRQDDMIGIEWCPNCQKFTERYLARRVKVKHIEFIPLASDVLDYYMMCGSCNYGSSVSRDSYEEIKHVFAPFNKRKEQIRCFRKAAEMAENMENNELSVNAIMDALAAEFPIRATQQLEGEYRRRIRTLLAVHGRGGSPEALRQPAEPPQQQQAPQQRKPAVMDEI